MNTIENRIQIINRRIHALNRKKEYLLKQLSEGCRVTPEPAEQKIVSRKTEIFSRYINPHNIDLNTVPF